MKKTLIIFLKELKDSLRDRRTVFMMIALPLIMMYVFSNIAIKMQMRQVVKSKERALSVALITNNNAEDFKTTISKRSDMILKLNIDEENAKKMIEQDQLDFAIVFPANFDEIQKEYKSGSVSVYYKNSRDIEIAKERISKMLDDYKKDILNKRLEDKQLDQAFVNPIEINSIDLATAKERIGEILGGMLPYIFIIFCFMGAMYPAIDLAAGEKERKTIETLLSSPASRMQIVLGKFLVVVLAGITSAVVSIVGLFLAFKGVKEMPQKGLEMILRLVETKSVLLTLSLLVPLCVFLAAMLLSMSIYAKSYKEAQSIIAPMNIVVIIPALIGMMPGIKLTATTALIPILNVSLATKEIVSGTIKMGLLFEVYAALFILAALGIWFCTMWFKREDVIFRGM